MSTTYRLPQPGDLVTRNGNTLYRVDGISDQPTPGDDLRRRVLMTSERSGRQFGALLAHLSWPRGEDGRIHPVIPWELRTVRPRQPESSGGGRSRPAWGSDSMSAAVISWDTPYPDDDPSAVAVGVSYVPSRGDSHGERYLHLAASGPRGDAYLDQRSARDLVGHLSRLLGQM